MALLLVAVALVSALVTMRLAVHGREVEVPDVRGRSPAEARRVAEPLGLTTQTERQYYSATVPEGRVLSQMPAAGSVVRRGWELRLAVSLGPQRVTIPQVVGESQRAAAIILQQRGLDSSTAEISLTDAADGQVVGQAPPANAADVASPKVSMLVAQDAPEAFVMPSFIGRPLGSVALALKDAGFTLGKVTFATLPGSVAVAAQGNAAPAASSAVVSPASASVPAPPISQAQSPARTPSAPSPSPASIIQSQDPAPGQKITAGDEIRFVVR
jgi:beta-lactam-binding protein with PASTA domain